MSNNCSVITRLISEDQVKAAISKIEEFLLKLNEKYIINILYALYELVYRVKKEGTKCNSSPADIFKATNLLCSNSSIIAKSNRLLFMRCLYHITSYLLQEGESLLAKDLCNYFFKLEDINGTKEWAEKEELVLSTVIYNFRNYLNENIDRLIDFENHQLFTDWIEFILKLIQLNNFRVLSEYLRQMAKLFLIIIKTNKNIDYYCKCGTICIDRLTLYFTESEHSFVLDTKTFESCLLFLDTLVYYLSADNIKAIFGPVLDLLKSVETLVECKDRNTVEYLKKCFFICRYSNSGDVPQYCEEIRQLLADRIDNVEAKLLTSSILSTFREDIFKNEQISKPTLVTICKELVKQCFKCPLNSRACYEIVKLLDMAFILVSADQSDTEFLRTVINHTASMLKQFAQYKNDFIAQNISVVVSRFVNVLLTYQKANLVEEASTLSKILLKFLLTIESDSMKTKSFKICINCALKTLATLYSERGFGVEAQIALAAFVVKHPYFTETVFTVWSELKVKDKSFNFNQETTIIDILTNYADTIESDWTNFDLELIDNGVLLLHEISSYTKHRSLRKEPVLAAYRQAAKVVKDDFQLAAILIATIESITTDGVCPFVNNFEVSLKNLLQSLQTKYEKQDDPREKCRILTLQGSLYYQQIRCELLQLRKKCGDEVNVLDVKFIRDVPILQGDEKDELDACNVIPAYSYLRSENLIPIMAKMDSALKSWSDACELIVDNENVDTSWLYHLKSLGYIYRLYNYTIKELEVWELLYFSSAKLSQTKYQVIAVAELLAITKDVDPSIIEETVKILSENTSSNLSVTSYVCQLFYVNLAKNLYYRGNIEECKKTLEKLDFTQIKYNFLVYAQLKILMTLIKFSYPNTTFVTGEGTLEPMMKIFENLRYISKNEKWNTFVELSILQWLLLYSAYLLGTILADIKQVRLSRSYVKNQLTQAQRLCLPLRVCELLGSLGWSDTYCVNVEECEAKLIGIETMLGMDTIPCQDYYAVNARAERSGSPTLRTSFQFQPKFLSHNRDCLCDQCMNLSYQIQALNCVTLRARVFVAGDLKQPFEFIIKIGFKLIDFIAEKLNLPQNKGLITELEDYKVRFFMVLCEAYIIWSERKKAEEYNKMALQVVSAMKVPNLALKGCVLEARNATKWIIYPMIEEKPPTVFVRKRQKQSPSPKTPEIRQCKTPVTKDLPAMPTVGKTKFKRYGRTPITPHPYVCKKIQLYNDADDEAELEKSMKTLNINDEKLPIIEIDDSFCVSNEKVISDFLTPKPNKSKSSKTLLTVPHDQNTPVAMSLWKTPAPTRTAAGRDVTDTGSKSVRTYTRRKVQTEKKSTSKKQIMKDVSSNLFGTPCVNTFRSPVKIYCDDDEITSTVKRTTRKTVKKTGASTTSKKKTVERKLFIDEQPTTAKDSSQKPPTGTNQKKIGRVLFSDDSDDDLVMVVPIANGKRAEKSAVVGPKVESNTNQNGMMKKPAEHTIRIDSDVSIVEVTPPKRRTTRRKMCLKLTPK